MSKFGNAYYHCQLFCIQLNWRGVFNPGSIVIPNDVRCRLLVPCKVTFQQFNWDYSVVCIVAAFHFHFFCLLHTFSLYFFTHTLLSLINTDIIIHLIYTFPHCF